MCCCEVVSLEFYISFKGVDVDGGPQTIFIPIEVEYNYTPNQRLVAILNKI